MFIILYVCTVNSDNNKKYYKFNEILILFSNYFTILNPFLFEKILKFYLKYDPTLREQTAKHFDYYQFAAGIKLCIYTNAYAAGKYWK